MAMLNNQMVYYSVNIITNYSSMISMNYWYWLLWLDMIAKNAISIAPLYYTNNISLVISHGNARGNKYCSSIAIITTVDGRNIQTPPIQYNPLAPKVQC